MKYLENPAHRWDAKSWIELKPRHREFLLWLGRTQKTRQYGRELDQVCNKYPNQKFHDQMIWLLQSHLELIDKNPSFMDSDNPRWRITDGNTLFQLEVFRELQDPQSMGSPEAIKKVSLDTALKRMETLEGQALEKLAAR